MSKPSARPAGGGGVTLGDRIAGAALGAFLGVPTALLVWLLANLLCAYADVPGPTAFWWLGVIGSGFVAVGLVRPEALPALLGWVWQTLARWLTWV